MLQFILKRAYYGFLVLFGVATVIFFLFNVLPGDPARMMLGQRADSASVAMINKDLGRDKSLPLQYISYINDLSFLSIYNTENTDSYWFLDKIKYDNSFKIAIIKSYSLVIKTPYLRRSYQNKRSVSSILIEALPSTAVLALVSMFFAVLVGIYLGVVSAIKKDSFFDKATLVIGSIGMSLPSFFMAILVAWLFSFVLGKYTGLNMYGSMYSIDEMGNGEFFDIKNLILPAFTLSIRPLAVIIQLTRNSMLEVMSQDYIRTARAKGLKYKTVIIKHALKNAMNPVVTAISGWIASLMAGAVFVEYIFDWKGVGVVIVNALDKYDLPVVMGSVLMISVILVVVNIIVDILYGVLDPRIRLN
ncbi:MAG: ABC transporter permease [Bacteroidota bacterium]